MNGEPRTPGTLAVIFYFVVLVLVFGVMGWRTTIMLEDNRPEPIGADRAAQRREALETLKAANAEALNHYGWVDQNRGIVRLTIDRAMELTVQEWADPEKGRAILKERLEETLKPAEPAANPYL